MSELLISLLKAGLIENINGDDDRFAKMCKAVDDITNELSESPVKLIDAIIAAINPNVSIQNPAIITASEAITKHWPTISSVHTNPPINLFRALLCTACSNAAENNVNNAATIWLTAVDMFPLFKLGGAEKIISTVLTKMAEEVERYLLGASVIKNIKEPSSVESLSIPDIEEVTPFTINKEKLSNSVAKATAPRLNNVVIENANQNWPSQNEHWVNQFVPKITDLLVKQFNELAQNTCDNLNESKLQLKDSLSEINSLITKSIQQQRSWLTRKLNKNENLIRVEQNKINTLWWYEALYSSSLYCSYRELEPEIACIVMAFDLLEQLSLPTPISTAYILSEAVCRLSDVEFSKKYKLFDLLNTIKENKDKLPSSILEKLEVSNIEQQMTIRDLVIAVLTHNNVDVQELINNTGINIDTEITLPSFSRAVFRQEQAVRIARK